MSGHGKIAWVVGAETPALSISWAPPVGPNDSGFIIFMADDPGLDDVDPTPLCLHCLLDVGGEQLGRGLDLARLHAQVDYDESTGEWFIPDDAVSAS